MFLVVRTGDVSPFLDDSAEVDAAERHVNLSYLIMLREPIEVVDSEHECLGAHLGVRHLKTPSTVILV